MPTSRVTSFVFRQHPTRFAIFFMVVAASMGSIGDALIKFLSADHGIFQIIWARSIFFLFFFVFFNWRNWRKAIQTRRPFLQFFRALLLLIAGLLLVVAIKYIPLANAIAVFSVSPLLVTALSVPILGEKVGLYRWAAICCGFLGVLVLLNPTSDLIFWIALLPLAGACCYAFFQILTKIVCQDGDISSTLLYTCVVSAALTTFCLPFSWSTPSVENWLLMISLGVVYGFSHLFFLQAHSLAPVSTIAPFAYFEVVSAVIIGLVIFGEWPNFQSLFGIVLIVWSGIYTLRSISTA